MSAFDYEDVRHDLLTTTEQLYRLIDPRHTLTRSALIATARVRVASQDALQDIVDAVENCIDALLDTLIEPAHSLAA